MDLSKLSYADGARKNSKRIGRGQGSGLGKTAGKGHKGQNARSGRKHRAWFEGGQMPLQRRVPKRGFTNIFRKHYEVVNVGDLERMSTKVASPETLYTAKLVRKKRALIKILGNGDVKKSIEVRAHAFSSSAVEKIEGAGGKAVRL